MRSSASVGNLNYAAEKLFPQSQRPDELWMYVVWILLFLLVMEIFVANRTLA